MVKYRYPQKYLVSLQDIFKTSSRHIFKTSSRHAFKTSSRHVFKTSSRLVFKTSSRRPQNKNFLSSKSSSKRLARCLQDVFAKRLQDVLEEEKLLRWRRVEDVFKTNKCLLGNGFLIQNSCRFLILLLQGNITEQSFFGRSFPKTI